MQYMHHNCTQLSQPSDAGIRLTMTSSSISGYDLDEARPLILLGKDLWGVFRDHRGSKDSSEGERHVTVVIASPRRVQAFIS